MAGRPSRAEPDGKLVMFLCPDVSWNINSGTIEFHFCEVSTRVCQEGDEPKSQRDVHGTTSLKQQPDPANIESNSSQD